MSRKVKSIKVPLTKMQHREHRSKGGRKKVHPLQDINKAFKRRKAKIKDYEADKDMQNYRT